MNILLDPNVAYVLLVGGFLLAILALFSPGTGLLELGALFSLLLAGYSIYNLPINGWAMLVLALGVFPFLLAVRRSRNWLFLVVSIAALVGGSLFLFRNESGGPAVNWALAAIVSLLTAGFMWLVARKGLEAVARPKASLDNLIGMTGEARTSVFHEGAVYVAGEEWTARSAAIIPAGSRVRVLAREGLLLIVEPVHPQKEAGE